MENDSAPKRARNATSKTQKKAGAAPARSGLARRTTRSARIRSVAIMKSVSVIMAAPGEGGRVCEEGDGHDACKEDKELLPIHGCLREALGSRKTRQEISPFCVSRNTKSPGVCTRTKSKHSSTPAAL